jgi:hypothetical protein
MAARTGTITTMDTNQSAVSWSAIAAGATAAVALTLVLITIGTALGFSSISPWPNAGVSAKTFQLSSGLYLVFTALIASTIGGYISGRLRTKWNGIHNYEIQFRDTAHGFLAWGFATIVGAAVLAGAVTALLGGTATGAAVGTGTSAGQGASNSNTDYYVALLMRPAAAPSSASGVDNAAPRTTAVAGPNEPNGGIAARQTRFIVAHSIANGGEVSNDDRAYLAQLVSRQTGANQADAEKRVSDVMTQARAALDQARKVAASISIWSAIAMLVGAFSASLAAIEGGQLRDRRWRGVFGTRAYTEARIET